MAVYAFETCETGVDLFGLNRAEDEANLVDTANTIITNSRERIAANESRLCLKTTIDGRDYRSSRGISYVDAITKTTNDNHGNRSARGDVHVYARIAQTCKSSKRVCVGVPAPRTVKRGIK